MAGDVGWREILTAWKAVNSECVTLVGANYHMALIGMPRVHDARSQAAYYEHSPWLPTSISQDLAMRIIRNSMYRYCATLLILFLFSTIDSVRKQNMHWRSIVASESTCKSAMKARNRKSTGNS